MLEWQGLVVAAICLVITAVASRYARRAIERRQARKRQEQLPAQSRQVRRAQERKRRA